MPHRQRCATNPPQVNKPRKPVIPQRGTQPRVMLSAMSIPAVRAYVRRAAETLTSKQVHQGGGEQS